MSLKTYIIFLSAEALAMYLSSCVTATSKTFFWWPWNLTNIWPVSGFDNLYETRGQSSLIQITFSIFLLDHLVHASADHESLTGPCDCIDSFGVTIDRLLQWQLSIITDEKDLCITLVKTDACWWCTNSLTFVVLSHEPVAIHLFGV